MGLSSCWVAGDKKPYAEAILKAVSVPAEMKLIALVPIGHEAERPLRAVKKPIDQVIHWESF
jgi:nitroreductase